MKYSLDKYKYFVARHADGTPYQVIAVSTYGGKIVRGVAKAHPNDMFDLEKGKRLAAARCNLKVAQKRVSRATKKFAEASQAFAEINKHKDRMARYLQDALMEADVAQKELNNLISEF